MSSVEVFYAMRDVETGKYLYVNYCLYSDTYSYLLVDRICDLTNSSKSCTPLIRVAKRYLDRAKEDTGFNLELVLIEKTIEVKYREIKETEL